MDEPDAERTRRLVERRYFSANDFLRLWCEAKEDEEEEDAADLRLFAEVVLMLLLLVSCLMSLTIEEQ